MVSSQTTLVGAAGEYYVMSELLRRGFVAALAPQGVPNTDIVVSSLDGDHLCSIQVKSRRDLRHNTGWHMNQKQESLRSPRLFYCFVDFGKSEFDHPTIHVLPSAIVADALVNSYRQWLSSPGLKGRAHKDHAMRRLTPDCSALFGDIPHSYGLGWLDQYRDAWHLLGLELSTEDESSETSA